MGVNFARFVYPNVNTPKVFWMVAGGYCFGFLALWAILNLSLKKCRDKLGDVKSGTWALKIMIFVHHAAAAPLSAAALMQDPAVRSAVLGLGLGEGAAKLTRDPAGPSLAAAALIPMTIGYMAADLLLIRNWNLMKSGNAENGLMVLHHILSMISWPVTLYYNYCQRYVLFLELMEISSIFMQLNWFLSQGGMKNSVLYVTSGALFTLSFFLSRWFLAVPQVMSMITAPPLFQPLSDVPTWALLNGPCWMILPHLLNAFWGVKVYKGFMAVVFPSNKAQSQKDKPS